MAPTSINIVVGGEAGQGLVTVGEMLAKALVRAGYQIVVSQDYLSRIRGGLNTFALRAAVCCIHAPVDHVDLLVALSQDCVDVHAGRLTEKGLLLLPEDLDARAHAALVIPFKELAKKPMFENIAAAGVVASLMGLDKALLEGLVRDAFGKKGEAVVAENIAVLDAAYAWAAGKSPNFEKLPAPEHKSQEMPGRLMMAGNDAIALGALAAGADFCSFYPMTPATSIAVNLIAAAGKTGMIVEQAEDEIAAINMGIGAAHAGAKVIVPTSGGGFALMVEGVSLAGMMETPIVIGLAMRPGPATGLPTRTAQGDLNLALYAGHGEFPRAILAPGTVEQCFKLTHRAFDLAERSQGPVFVLTDQYTADSFRSVAPFDFEALPPIVQPLFSVENPAAYERYAVTESGVSPRLLPGFTEALVVADSDEHTPDGHITEDLTVRVAMQDKRMRKLELLKAAAIPPDLYGPEAHDTLFVCWGSSLGACLEAADILNERGEKAAVLHFTQVYPLHPDQFMNLLDAAPRTVLVEGNQSHQFGQLLARDFAFVFDQQIPRYDGLHFTAKYILDRM